MDLTIIKVGGGATINLAGIALMLDLLDEIESLRAGQLGQQ